jgi:hypothetical protein
MTVALKRRQTGQPAVDRTASPARALLSYNLLRAALLAACLGLGYVAGLRGLLLIVAALLVSGVLSWFLLTRQRVSMGAAIEQSVARGRARMAARTAAEDAYADDVARQREPHTSDSRSADPHPAEPPALS